MEEIKNCVIFIEVDKGHDVNGNPKRYIDAWLIEGTTCKKVNQIIEHENESYRSPIQVVGEGWGKRIGEPDARPTFSPTKGDFRFYKDTEFLDLGRYR